jgi:hypothetical protein
MRRYRFALLAAMCVAFAGAGPAVAALQPEPGVRAEPAARLAARLLEAHNRERAAVGVPPLLWDGKLAADAASYGPGLAALGGNLQHSPRASRPDQAENLFRGQAGRYSPEAMVDYWAEEKKWFLPGIFPANSSTGNWLDVSHYTQMIWRTTTHVGCAIYRSGGWDYLICRYTPRGNKDGKRVP